MSLLDTIKKQVIEAMKAKDTLTRDVLRVLQGDIEMHHTRTGEHMTDDQAQKVVRKLVKSNQETLAVKPDADAAEKLNKEIAILEALLPRTLSVDEIASVYHGGEDGILPIGEAPLQTKALAVRLTTQSVFALNHSIY